MAMIARPLLALVVSASILGACATTSGPSRSTEVLRLYLAAQQAYDSGRFAEAATLARQSGELAGHNSYSTGWITADTNERHWIRMPDAARELLARAEARVPAEPAPRPSQPCTVRDRASGLLVRRSC